MLKVNIPKNKYWISDYPNLDPNAEGLVIPEAWGTILDATPICINTSTGVWKIAAREIKEITEIRSGSDVLVLGIDYSEDLANAQFTIEKTPYLNAATIYYIKIEGNWVINGADYIRVCRTADGYAGGQAYYIDGSNVWTGQSVDMIFKVWGKDSIDGNEEVKAQWINFHYVGGGWGGWDSGLALRDAVARTALGQSFTTGGSGFYVTRIDIHFKTYGSVSGNISLKIFSAITPAEVQVGAGSYSVNAIDSDPANIRFPQRVETSDLRVDFKGYMNVDTTLMTNVADILQDVYVNILGGSSGDLDTAAFTALKAARAQVLKIYLNREMAFEMFSQKLEAGQLFKFLPDLDGLFTVQYYASGEPAGTPHFRDEDLKNFSMYRDWRNVFQKVCVKYDENPSTQEWQSRESESTIAECLYKNQETLMLETWLSAAADALQLAKDYLGTDVGSSRKQHLQYPPRSIKFEVAGGYGHDLIPTQKVKITRTRADYTNGILSAVLFRILKVEKKIETVASCVITAILDSLTY